MKIVINAGHGPETPGKRSPDGSLREYHFNAPVARRIGALLQQYEGVEILHPFEDGRDVPLKERTDRANTWGADLYVSIHANAAGDGASWSSAQGIETFVHDSRPRAAEALAIAIQRKIIAATGRPDRGVKSANFHELRETKCTAVLVECGFMTNQQECELLKSDAYREKCALAIVAAIVETYGLRRKEQPVQDDVSPWAREARDWAVGFGITDGTRPKDPVTREELWTMLHRMRR